MTLGLFEAYGIELEYMLVDRKTLAVAPICDRVLAEVAGEGATEFADGPIAWSNELALHVIEVKTNGPVPLLDASVATAFTEAVCRIDAVAATHGARLLPGAVHPTMNPGVEAVLWPHEGRPVYEAFDRLFDCRRHGWTNLQACHLNLPFDGSDQFGRLHAAIRAVLPLLPALAASSPILEGKRTGAMNTRLSVYCENQRRIAAIMGDVIPEPVYTPEAYQTEILEPMYRAIAPEDPSGMMQHEWLNSRGAIARFERNAIEIRLLDVQETPLADIAITRLVSTVVRALAEERWVSQKDLQALPTAGLRQLLDAGIVSAEQAAVDSRPLLAAIGIDDHRASASEVWTSLLETLLLPELPPKSPLREALRTIVGRGPLARRIADAAGPTPKPTVIAEIYGQLADCLVQGRMFTGR